MATAQIVGSPQASHTSDFTVFAPGYHDNKGATGMIVGTLLNVPRVEVTLARVADYELRLKPPPGRKILWSGSDMATDEYLAITGPGVLTCVVNPDGDAQVMVERGDIQEESAA